MARQPYGFNTHQGNLSVNEKEAPIVREIYKLYLAGHSSSVIADMLTKRQTPSPSQDKWNRTAIDNILTNKKYTQGVITPELYTKALLEKEQRSNKDSSTGKRKTARYHSKNVLSGLLICADCGATYRRITRSGGEVVWRCGNKVEHGSRICQSAPTISDVAVKDWLCERLGMDTFEPHLVREHIDSVVVDRDGRLIVRCKKSLCVGEEAPLFAMV